MSRNTAHILRDCRSMRRANGTMATLANKDFTMLVQSRLSFGGVESPRCSLSKGTCLRSSKADSRFAFFVQVEGKMFGLMERSDVVEWMRRLCSLGSRYGDIHLGNVVNAGVGLDNTNLRIAVGQGMGGGLCPLDLGCTSRVTWSAACFRRL